MRRFRVCIFGLMMLSLCVLGFVKPSSAESRGGYEINSYDCHYKVSEDNIFHVEETIDVTFNEPRHGIYRYIPRRNEIERLDGTKDMIKAEIDVKSCSDPYVLEGDVSDNETIRIGDADKEITGQHTYTISYDMKWGNDRVEGADEFYVNLVGDGWDVPVRNLSFTIEMPKEFSDTGDNIGFYYGATKESKIDGILYSFDGKTIRGELKDNDINPGEFFTVRIQLEDGYFLQRESEFPTSGLIAVILSIVFLLVSFLIWSKFGRDKPIVEVVEFYPPDGLNCAEIAYVYKGECGVKDVIPLIIELAEEGCIEIVQNDKNGKGFMFRILKSYEGEDEAKRTMLEELSKYGETVTEEEIKNKFYTTIGKITTQIRQTMNKKVFFRNSHWLRLITIPFAIVPVYLGMFGVISGYWDDGIAFLAQSLLFFLLMPMVLFVFNERHKVVSKAISGTIGIVVIALYIIIIAPAITYTGWFCWIVFGVTTLGEILQFMFFRIMERRTDYGTEITGKVRGFRNYLMTAEKAQLEARVESDPEYYYRILPFTYVLGITDAWVKRFEGIVMEPPSWYRDDVNIAFDLYVFNHFMNDTISSAQSAMTSSPGGSDSGGGFSGGGGGGGGGGSW